MKINNMYGIVLSHKKTFKPIRALKTGLILLSLFIASINYSIAQDKNLSLDFTNTSISNIITNIEQQTGYSFFYTDEIDLSRNVTISVQNESLKSVLDKIFSTNSIQYKITDKRIVLYKNELKQDATLYRASQTDTNTAGTSSNQIVTGTVVDSKGISIPGATVLVKGTAVGVNTDSDGKFSIKVPSSSSILQASFIGFTTSEVTVGKQKNIMITLKDDAISLDEVIVTGVATGTSRAKLSFTVDKVKGNLLTEVPAISAATALQGKVAGLKIYSNSGNPNDEPMIQLRGTASFSGASAPLVIVDGVFTDGGLRDINAEDIENIEVIKGAAAASFYGARAANGVVNIITKRGSSLEQGKTIFSIKSEFGVSWQTFNPMKTTAHGHKVDENGNPTRDLDDDQIWDNPYIFNHNAYSEVFRPSLYTSNQVSIQGNAKSGNMSYYASYQYQDNKGIINLLKGVQRHNIRLNLDHRISDKFSVSASNAFIRKVSDDRYLNFDDIYYADPNADFHALNLDGTPYKINPNIVSTRSNPNPLYTIANSYAQTNSNRFIGGYRLTYNLLPSVVFNAVYSIDYLNSSSRSLDPAGNLLPTNPDGSVRSTGFISMQDSRVSKQNISIDGMFSKTFGDFTTRYKMQYLYENRASSLVGGNGSKLALTGMDVISLELADPDTRDHWSYSDKVIAESVTGIAYADYKGKYIVDALIRREGVSLFGENERWQTYFRVSGAWNIVKDFEIPSFEYLKPRISYGTAGLFPGFSDQYETFNLSNGKILGGAQLGNKDLRPAFSQELEIGLDGRFLDRFDFNFSYSHKRNTDQIFSLPVSAITGFEYQITNIGEFFVKSWEFSFNANIIRSTNFAWDANLTWDKLQMQIGDLGRDPFWDGMMKLESNTPWGDMYSSSFARSLDDVRTSTLIKPGQTAEDVFTINNYGWVVRKDLIGTRDEAKMTILDENGNTKQVFIGNTIPNFTTNITNTLSYKNWQLYFTLSWQQGGDLYNNTKVYMSAAGRNAKFWDMSDRPWEQRKALSYVNQHARKQFTEDASFLKLRELSVSYTFNKELLSNLNINFFQRVRIALVARNLYTLTKYSGPEPETRNISSTGTALGEDTPKYPGGAAFFSGSLILDF